MMGPLDLLAEPVGQRLTWTLLHFLWQGLAISAALLAMLWLLRVHRARARYALCLAAMLTMAVCPLVTFALLQVDVRQVPLNADVGWDAAQRNPAPTHAKVTLPPDPSPATHPSEPFTAAATPSAPPPIPTEATSHGQPARPPMAATSSDSRPPAKRPVGGPWVW
ncbi:MAG: hypothetical protein A2V70_19830 [Planctomycetes bacterium RBG_13_63_9]|nr:MAG: hypothetical protein A2V70_19830 [Planctomycetes bacterium RBG_13_63_9]